MRAPSQDFLFELLEAPSPSGSEQPAQRLIRKWMKPVADEILTDVHGNTMAVLNPRGKPRVMLAGHVDQIGFMVRYINDDGFVHFGPVGGVDASVVPGLTLWVHTPKGPVKGVVGRKAIHLMKTDERHSNKIDLSDLWLDIGAKNRAEAEKRVAIGHFITYALGVTRLGGELVASPGMDDKIGVFVVMEALQRIRASRKKLSCAVYAVATVQEELGLRGARTAAFGIDPQVGIAVDVTHSADYPGADKKALGDLALGKGPVLAVGPNINPVLGDLLVQTARKRRIPFQREGEPRATGTDANAMQINRCGVAAALVSIPNRCMHTPVEVVHLGDADQAVQLLAETCLAIHPKLSFIPS